ncbi:hypothetical protein C8R47DRAFT_70337 [Mycena vitilis]|nr:hypothetical protein C8R47DRAFT_70337 [Mycena vitilis]
MFTPGLGRKRKAAEELSPLSMYQHALQRIRKDPFLAGVEEAKWAKFSENLLGDPQLPGVRESRPFEDARPFHGELFEDEDRLLPLAQEPANTRSPPAQGSAPSIFEEAAAELRLNALWKGVENHVVMGNEIPSCRIVIDLVLLAAINIAQKEINGHLQLDDKLRRHHHSLLTTEGGIGSQVVLHREVDIPPQDVLPHLSFYGVVNYAFDVVSTDKGVFTPHFLKPILDSLQVRAANMHGKAEESFSSSQV